MVDTTARARTQAADLPRLITPAELPNWVSGRMLGDSAGHGWNGVTQRTYDFHGQDVILPPIDSFKIVQYLNGTTPMDREIGGRWTRTECGPGKFSLLSRATTTQWNWTENLIVSHAYLSEDLMLRVAFDMTGGARTRVELHDVLQAVDPVVSFIMDQLRREVGSQSAGGALYAESLSVQLAVHLLRNYASFGAPRTQMPVGLSQRQINQLKAYIDAHLADSISMDDMARVLDMGVWTFMRHAKRALGKSACALVQEHRVDRARMLLVNRPAMQIKEIAAACGFSDQAHMTRAFRTQFALTPGQYRQRA